MITAIQDHQRAPGPSRAGRAGVRHRRAIALVGAVLLLAAGCGRDAGNPELTEPPELDSAIQIAARPAVAQESRCARRSGASCAFDHDNFDDSTVIDNQWLPMVPGTQLVYEGRTNEEHVLREHRVVITVTDLTKVIDGVEAVVSWDLDFSNGELAEAELAFFAQDNDGNVWRMGEHPEEYEGGRFVGAPTWIAGVNGASAGISMLATPVVDGMSYSQGWAPDVEFIDRGVVQEVAAETCVAVGCFTDVLIVAEFNTEEANAWQLKYFAPDIGNVRVGWRGVDETQEELELVSVVRLDAIQLAEAREAALAVEAHAYVISPDIYGRTPPATVGG